MTDAFLTQSTQNAPLTVKQRIDWFYDILKINDINRNKGTINCGHCALRVDDYIRNGKADDIVEPVLKGDAKLYSFPVFHPETQSIRRSSTTDTRILDRCTHHNRLSSETLLAFDVTNDDIGPILDLTYENQTQQNNIASVRLTKKSGHSTTYAIYK
jgi:hypothetical protein